jgi:hypothetical protein
MGMLELISFYKNSSIFEAPLLLLKISFLCRILMNTQKTYRTYHEMFKESMGKIINFDFLSSNLMISLSQTLWSSFFTLKNSNLLFYIGERGLSNDHYYFVYKDLNKLLCDKNHLLHSFLSNSLASLTTGATIKIFDTFDLGSSLTKAIAGSVVSGITKQITTGNYEITDLFFGMISGINAITEEEDLTLFKNKLVEDNGSYYNEFELY